MSEELIELIEILISSFTDYNEHDGVESHAHDLFDRNDTDRLRELIDKIRNTPNRG